MSNDLDLGILQVLIYFYERESPTWFIKLFIPFVSTISYFIKNQYNKEVLKK